MMALHQTSSVEDVKIELDKSGVNSAPALSRNYDQDFFAMAKSFGRVRARPMRRISYRYDKTNLRIRDSLAETKRR